MFQNDADHTIEGRHKNAERISHTCRMLDRQGIHVIATVLSIFPEWQKWNREQFDEYCEVFLDIPLETLINRDVKELYQGAKEGRIPNVVGIDIPFPRPPYADIIIDEGMQQHGVSACAAQILKAIPDLT
jgi:adenylylsulfate kinase